MASVGQLSSRGSGSQMSLFPLKFQLPDELVFTHFVTMKGRNEWTREKIFIPVVNRSVNKTEYLPI